MGDGRWAMGDGRWVLVAFGLILSLPARGQYFCGDLQGATVGVGEGRVRLVSGGSISRYANAYHDSGHELSLTQSYPVGWLATDGWYYAGVSAAVEDESTTLCREMTVQVHFYSRIGTCSPDYGNYQGYARLKVQTCALPSDTYDCDTDDDGQTEECLFWGVRFISKLLYEDSGNIYYLIEAHDGVNMTTDSGCFNVGASEAACY